MKRAAIYARVSTEKQAEKELSIPAQLKELKQYARINDLVVVAEFTDQGISAKTDDRPAFQRMIAEAKQKPRPFDMILFHKNDRFARNREDAIVYKSLLRKDCGIELIAIKEDFGDGPVAMMIEGILEVIAEFYSLNLAQEVKKGMKEKAKQGKALGDTPLGYTIGQNGFYEIVPEEARVVQYIFNEYTQTEKGLRSIANDLRSKGPALFGEVGGKYRWSSAGVRKILTNPAYIGELVWNRRDNAENTRFRDKDDWITVEKAHQPIVELEVFKEALEVLASKRTKRSESEDYILRGLVRCKDCGSSMSQFSYHWKRKNGNRARSRQLRCSEYVHSGDCYFNHVSMKKLEKNLFSYLRGLLIDKIDPGEMNISFRDDRGSGSRLRLKQTELAGVKERFERQMLAFENGIINLEDLKRYQERLKEEELTLEKEVADLEASITSENINTGLLKKKIADIIDTVENEDISLRKRRKAVKSIVKFVEYSRNADEMAVHIKL